MASRQDSSAFQRRDQLGAAWHLGWDLADQLEQQAQQGLVCCFGQEGQEDHQAVGDTSNCSTGLGHQVGILGPEEGTSLEVEEDSPFQSLQGRAGDHLGPMAHQGVGRTSDSGRSQEHQEERRAALADWPAQDRIQDADEPSNDMLAASLTGVI